ncbi:MAG: hypothetical protein BMS9Abin26_0396 [Gammaproteobacteria bacterium]|nr:MAG: hypothetical protein BMS9Abin26_0396 [Gammaproteobacteria bacterium]
MSSTKEILKEALSLSPDEKAELVDELLVSLDSPEPDIEKVWAEEVEKRIDAIDQGKSKTISLEEVLQKYK